MKTFIVIVITVVLMWFSGITAKAEVTETFGSGQNQFSIAFVPIGNCGNAPDTTGSPNPAGSVGYIYNIGKYEISRDMINKANSEAGLGITLHSMSTITGGPRTKMPATGVSWNEAARFVNYLNTSQGYSPAYKFALQPGQPGYNSNSLIELWQLGDAGYNPANPFRNRLARYVLPSVDEWYKAAYYDPNKEDGAGGYWTFPIGSDVAPIPVSGGTEAGTAVYGQQYSQGPADVDNAGALSVYGVMGLGGNVFEWEETACDLHNNSTLSSRGERGGFWNFDSSFLSSSVRSCDGPASENNFRLIGFRVVSIPGIGVSEPSCIVSNSIYHAGYTGSGAPPWHRIDTSKSLHKETAISQQLADVNLINTAQGINGIVFDIQNLPDAGNLSSEDFEFQVSPQGAFDPGGNPPANWQSAPAPSSISVTPGDPDRVLIQWPDGSIMNRWLRITIKATPNTGLATPETYYIGHLLGETTGPDNGVFTVSFADITPIRADVGQTVDASSITDIDKNGTVSFADISAMRGNVGSQLTQISVP